METGNKSRATSPEQRAMGALVKAAVALVLLFGLPVSQSARAEGPPVQHFHWIIIATLIDRTTGEQVKQGKLEGSYLEFDDQASCQSVLEKVPPIPSDSFKVVLTCRKVSQGQGQTYL